MGEMNSAVTRVWPVFDCLFHQDPSGQKWLSRLLHMGSRHRQVDQAILETTDALVDETATRDRDLSGPLKKVLRPDRAEQIGRICNAYEKDIPPATAFLRWLLENPTKLQWPTARGHELLYGDEAQVKRQDLIAGDSKVREEALRELEHYGSAGSRRKWWAFEGYTSVDCLLETNKLLLLVEGKRTEPISCSTHWFPSRNQVIRNLECAQEMARRANKNFAVLVCTEKILDISDVEWEKSLPHMTAKERTELKLHYLGCVTWNAIASALCNGMTLPDDIDDAVQLCLGFR
jgi:hypothetical protein